MTSPKEATTGADRTVGMVAVHYPHRVPREEFVARVRHAVEVMLPTPGCQSAECWMTVTGEAVVSIGFWESEQAMAASLATARAAGVDFSYDEREARPREILRLVSCAETVDDPRANPVQSVQ
jgi:quinol monooxygenase YgiN